MIKMQAVLKISIANGYFYNFNVNCILWATIVRFALNFYAFTMCFNDWLEYAATVRECPLLTSDLKRLNAALYRIQGTADGEILFLNPACRLNHGSAFY